MLLTPKKLRFFASEFEGAEPNVQTAILLLSLSLLSAIWFFHHIFRLLIPRFSARKYVVVDVSIKKLHRCICVIRYMSHVGGKAGMSRRARENHKNRELKITFEKDNCIEIYCFLFGPHASFRWSTILFPFSSLSKLVFIIIIKFFYRANLKSFKFYKWDIHLLSFLKSLNSPR